MEPAKKTRGRVTEVLQELRRNVPGAREDLFHLVYAELKRLAAAKMRREPAGHTLQPTALVHEAWLKLMGRKTKSEWKDSVHLMRLAARAMRNVLVDHARARQAAKRGKRAKVDEGVLDQFIGAFEAQSLDVLALNEALEKLNGVDEPMARVVELRFFAGLTIEESAEVLGVSTQTVRLDWRMARSWLHQRLKDPD